MHTNQSIRTYLTSVFTSLLMTLLTLLATPYLIRWLGVGSFGLYRAALDWLGYLVILDFGLNETLVPILVSANTSTNPKDVRKALVSGVHAYLKTLPIKLFFGLLFVLFTPKLLPSHQGIWDIRIGCLIGVTASLLSPFQTFRALFEVKQFGYKVHKLLFQKTVLTTVLALIFARSHLNVRGQFLALLIGEILFHLSLAASVFSEYPGLFREMLHDPKDSNLRIAIRNLNVSNFLSNICSCVSYMTDNIIISLLLSPEHVTAFIISQRLITFANLHLFGISNASWASLVHLHARGDHTIFRRRFLELNMIIVTTGLITLGPIAAFNIHVIRLWVGSSLYGGDMLTIIASVNSILLALIAFWSWIFSGKGISNLLLPQYILFTGVNFLFSVICTRLFGIPGPSLGNLCAIFSVTFWVTPRLLSQHFDIPVRLLYRGILRPTLILSPFILLIWNIARSHSPAGWIQLLFEMGSSCLFLTLAAWFAVLKKEDRAVLIHRFRELKRLFA